MPTSRVVAVAYSGGRDSSALLHATVAAAQPLGVDVLALHVNHRLSRHADAWETHCRDVCARLGVPIGVARLADAPRRGDSIEAWARRARHAALRRMALDGGATLVLLAHHRRDQAETLLLQALRGGGVAGLAGMPRTAPRDGVVWARPWLDAASADIDAYVRRLAIAHIDDDSNADPRFARNRLRRDVWPALEAAFVDADVTLARAAEQAWQAAACLDELARIDLSALDAASPLGRAALPIDAWQGLVPARRSNVLRGWLRRAVGRTAATGSLVERLMRELPAARSGAAWPCTAGELRCYRGLLRHAGPPAADRARPRETRVAIAAAGRFALPGWGGTLHAEPVAAGGLAIAALRDAELRARTGGEDFQLAPGRPPRSLKKQFQAAGVPAWERDAPLVHAAGRLLFVHGLGVDARSAASPGEPQLALRWCRSTPVEAEGGAD